MTEPAILEATLFYSSVYLDRVRKRKWSVATRYHRENTLHQVDRLMKSPRQETSDTFIAAVGMLAGTGVVKMEAEDIY